MPGPLETGTSTLGGRVIDANTKQPIAGVEVRVFTFTAGVPRSAAQTTGVDGAFAFSDVAEGSYSVTTNALDYLPCFQTPDRPSGCSDVTVARDQKRADIELSLTAAAIGRGRIVDRNGTPVSGAQVRLHVVNPPHLESARAAGANVRFLWGRGAKTRDDGTFELRGVQPGEFYLEADIPPVKGSMALPRVFYPGVFQHLEATPVEFRSGLVADDLVIVIPSTQDNLLSVKVSSGPLAIGDVRASLLRSAPLSARTIPLNEDGTGTVKGIMEGRHFVAARGWIKDRAWAAFEMVDFVPPSREVSLQMVPAGRLSGRVVAQNGGVPPLEGVFVAAAWTHDDVEVNPMAPDQVGVAADGSFRLEGLFGRRTVRLIGLSPDWRLLSVMRGRSAVTAGIDVPLDTTVDITIVVARR